MNDVPTLFGLIPVAGFLVLALAMYPVMKWLGFRQHSFSTAICCTISGLLMCFAGFVSAQRYYDTTLYNLSDVRGIILWVAFLILYSVGVWYITQSNFGKCIAASALAILLTLFLNLALFFVIGGIMWM